jgi:type IV secretory pathway VirB10-like protein
MMSVLEDASNIAGRAVAGQGTYTTQVPSTMGQTILQSTMSIRPILKKNQGTPPRSSSPRTSISGRSMMCSSGGRPCLVKARRSISTTPRRSRLPRPRRCDRAGHQRARLDRCGNAQGLGMA